MNLSRTLAVSLSVTISLVSVVVVEEGRADGDRRASYEGQAASSATAETGLPISVERFEGADGSTYVAQFVHGYVHALIGPERLFLEASGHQNEQPLTMEFDYERDTLQVEFDGRGMTYAGDLGPGIEDGLDELARSLYAGWLRQAREIEVPVVASSATCPVCIDWRDYCISACDPWGFFDICIASVNCQVLILTECYCFFW